MEARHLPEIFLDERRAHMDVELHEWFIADDLEAVHLARFDDEDVTRAGFELYAIYYIMSAAFTDELDFIVGMAVRPRSFAWKAVEKKDGAADIALVGADEVV